MRAGIAGSKLLRALARSPAEVATHRYDIWVLVRSIGCGTQVGPGSYIVATCASHMGQHCRFDQRGAWGIQESPSLGSRCGVVRWMENGNDSRPCWHDGAGRCMFQKLQMARSTFTCLSMSEPGAQAASIQLVVIRLQGWSLLASRHCFAECSFATCGNKHSFSSASDVSTGRCSVATGSSTVAGFMWMVSALA